ncbi:anti-phage dCTP deaminase [Citrobacter freundii]|jgi:deoxycytidylate deaminase|uniref:ComE operon protein 2 n=3 Tax=Enterobacteriaceae TaxID=543 RepID=A0ABN8THX9_9ENTR|nr:MULTISPECIES: anti-phage dCTP deaminase [Enterobacteriaceae]ELZ5050003.1 deoxycytidylate deaminase [Enterobacter asburiae]MBT2082671.1 deoxycytidylate deaminase [Enterobacter hormaechei subsp. xiangfangensis]HBQ8604857.1 deoxycytidylate deaminase [Klebsiella pneumoniae]EFM0214584.1 deoxycytidylate deaminase [Escherichia coli]EKY3958519.1 deoxycytidylate deaminase [Enterobacter roggenkampii]
MAEQKFISELFLENNQFILVGLTGRTGSGCTTTANILESKSIAFPELSGLSGFYKGLDKRRYSIVKKFAEEHWENFYSIKVSDLISIYLLLLPAVKLTSFIYSCGENIAKKSCESLVRKGVLSKSFLKENYSDVIKQLLDHHSEIDFSDPKITRSFIRILQLVRKFTRDLKAELNQLESGLYVSVYQSAGKSIRRIGKVDAEYESKDFIPSSVFHLPETINRVIKSIRKVKNERAYVVIDAIRNPYEAKFFKDRYAAFHLVSINAPDEHRTRYLQKLHKFSPEQIKKIDDEESGKGDSEYKHLTNPNVKKCIEISDIHLFNPKNEYDNNNVLKAQIAWYIALMQHPGLISPTSMERVMQVAYTVKLNSGCISRQVGAVVTDSDNSIKSVGWNDVAQGQVPCAMRSIDGLINDFHSETYSHYERNNEKFREKAREFYDIFKPVIQQSNSFKGRNISYCFKDIHNSIDNKSNQVHTRALHAEENAFLQLAKYGGIGIVGGKLYTTASPCELCAKKAYQLGISEVVFIDPYPGITQDHIINIGTMPPKLIQFRGAIGKAYHRLYEQIIPIKDELDYMLK